ncbi:proprotein convertase P-domain-containing protein [bacterium]|nr:proprotein convertase P-domain-containing protein [bacterium]
MSKHYRIGTLLVMCLVIMTGATAWADDCLLSFEQRVAAQEAIERVLYRHRIWPVENQSPKPAFEQAISREVLERKVREYLLESALLESFWKRPVTGEHLQAELDRLLTRSKDPQALSEVISALQNDPFMVAECLARPLLVHRLITNWYAYDHRIHGDLKEKIELMRDTLNADTFIKSDQGEYREIHLLVNDQVSVNQDYLPADARDDITIVDREAFDGLRVLFSEQIGAITLDETRTAFILRLTRKNTDNELIGAVRTFTKRPYGSWFDSMSATIAPDRLCWDSSYVYHLSKPKAVTGEFRPDTWAMDSFSPYGRYYHTAVWTGSEMIVWGGLLVTYTGGCYNPVTDTWRETSITNVPNSRYLHTAIWTGDKMIIWGGRASSTIELNTGGRYDPVTDSWTPMTTTGAPPTRYSHSAVWTGSEMIVWGGYGCSDPPACSSDYTLNTGGRYNPANDYPGGTPWIETSTVDVPSRRYYHTAVWTGSEMIIWGGYSAISRLNTGGRYNPVKQDQALSCWTATSTTNVPLARYYHTAVWTGSEMIIWGGYTGDYTSTGSRYNPILQDYGFTPWIETDSASSSCPTGRHSHSAVWTGNEMLIWGGRDSTSAINNGSSYNPTKDDLSGVDPWTAFDTGDAPAERYRHTAVWTGSEMIVWGGFTGVYFLGSGARFNPTLNSWTATSEREGPVGRYDHTAVWTGSEMIIWGGDDGILYYDSGGCYLPMFDTWSETGTTSQPAARAKHTAVWTGDYMLIWGGISDSGQLNSGGIYSPTDTWYTLSMTGAPSPRSEHTAVWAGYPYGMLVWGGYDGSSYVNTGGRFFVMGGNSWSAMADAPIEGRARHSAVWTGDTGSSVTEYRLAVWGGYTIAVDDEYFADGALYSPDTNKWYTITTTGAPEARAGHSVIWHDNHMIIWGGGQIMDPLRPCFNDGYRYVPNVWTALPAGPAELLPRSYHTAIDTGTEMIVWGGSNYSYYFDNGARYNYEIQEWTDLPLPLMTAARDLHTTIWTGQEMIIWGGRIHDKLMIFYPNTPPTAAPDILNSSDTVVLGGTSNDLQLSHTLRTAVWDDIDSSSGWTATGLWNIVTSQNCSGQGDYTSPLNAWYCGNGATCQYEGPGTYTLTSPLFTIKPDSDSVPQFIFSSFLDTDATKEDTATVSLRLNSGSWTVIAYDRSNCPSQFIKLDDDGQAWQTVSVNLPEIFTSIPVGSTLEVEFSFTSDGVSNDHLGWLIDDIGVGDPSGDGNNGLTTVPYHDRWDKATFEWDLNEDGFSDNPDLSTPIWNIPEASLANYGLGQPGTYTLTLNVTDVLDLTDSDTVQLTVVDGTAPTCSVIIPNGGESWTYSASLSDPEYHQIVWNAADNFQLDRTILSYSTDGGGQWTTIYDTDSPDYTATDTPVTIATPGTVYSQISLPLNLIITDVDVTIDISHTYDWDLIISLIGPDNTTVILSEQNGDYGDNYTDTHFDDEGSIPIGSGTAPFTGTYIPDEALSAFDGKGTLGLWQLKVQDVYSADGGQINSWSIHFTVEQNSQYCVWRMPTAEQAAADGQTFPSANCLIRVEVEDESGNSNSDTSDNPFYIVKPTTSSVRSLILWNSARITSQYGSSAATALVSKLEELADHERVAGVVLDLNAAGIDYSSWDAAPTDQSQANGVATAIWDYLYNNNTGQITTTYTNCEYVILVGDDYQLPFYRMLDGTSIYPESEYPAEVGLNTGTTIGSALNLGYFLTDNYYSETDPEPSRLVGDGYIYQNDLAIGRMVETPAQIIEQINTFIAYDGEVDLLDAQDTVLVTGYDFLYDSAFEIKETYANAPHSKTTYCLLEDPDNPDTGDPCLDNAFTPSQLENQLFLSQAHKMINVNTHANHFNWGTSTGSPALLSTSTMEANPNQLTGTIVYSSGCHSGLPVPATDSHPLDLPEEMVRKKTLAYIGNTGYGWGLRYGIGLTEYLVTVLTDTLLEQDSSSIGKALSVAKRNYFLEERRYDVFDEKVVHILTLFGIPNTLVVNATAKSCSTRMGLPGPTGPDHGCADGICLDKHLSDGHSSKDLPAGMTELELNFSFGSETYQEIVTDDGSYYTLNNTSSNEVGSAIQPQFIYDSQLSGTIAHGVLFIGGAYAEYPSFDPVVAVPRSTNADQGEGPLPLVSGFTPCIRVSYGTSGGSAQKSLSQVGYTNLVVQTGYIGDDGTTELKHNDMQFVIYYSNNPDDDAPIIQDPGSGGFHTLDGLEAVFTVSASDSSGVYRVLVTYNDKRTQAWKSFELEYDSISGNWTGTLSLMGSIIYFVQAVDNAGNIAILTQSGADLDGDEPPTPYGSTWAGPTTFEIILTDSDDDGLPDVYENAHPCLDPGIDDTEADPDYDYLSNESEFGLGTDPCDGDSDGGGDNDGSELNNGRKTDDFEDDLTIFILVDKYIPTNTYTISWPDVEDQNALIDGYYFVYRSDDPIIEPTDLVYGPLDDLTKSQADINPSCDPCYYQVWNYELSTLPPDVKSVVPDSGPASTTQDVEVFGDHFISGAEVTFCGTHATKVTVINPSKITCTTPALAAGFCDVKVINPNAQEGLLEDGYEYE